MFWYLWIQGASVCKAHCRSTCTQNSECGSEKDSLPGASLPELVAVPGWWEQVSQHGQGSQGAAEGVTMLGMRPEELTLKKPRVFRSAWNLSHVAGPIYGGYYGLSSSKFMRFFRKQPGRALSCALKALCCTCRQCASLLLGSFYPLPAAQARPQCQLGLLGCH